MTIERSTVLPRIVPALAAVLALALPVAVAAQSHHPPPEPPADWGPISINLEGYEYPHPVDFMNFRVYGQDVRIAYMDVAPTGPANGRAVVLHHGGSYYGWYWKSQIEALAGAGYRVVVKDRLGWGKSSKPVLPYSMSLHAFNTARLMDHLGIDEAAIVGHSIGGQMATRFAFLYPERTTHLVTVNQVGLTDRRPGRGFQPFDGEVDADPDLQAAYEADVRTDTRRYVKWRPEFIDHLRIRHGQRLSGDWPRLAYIRRLGGNLRSMDTVVDDWPHIKARTLILGGEIDGPEFPANARRAAEILPKGEVFLIPDVGHNPHEEVPDVVNAELLRFLGAGSEFAQGQSADAPAEDAAWEMPRLADGQPDLQGYWTTQTFTPMERPEYLGDQAFYSEEEFALLQSQLTVDGADPLARFAIEIADPEERARALDQTHRDETYVHYDNAIWLATRVPKGLSTRRTSLIVDPPNGRIPPRNEQALARVAEARAARGDRGAFDGYELRPHSERCLNYRYNAPPLQPPSYNDIHQILQTPTHIVIFTEQSTNGPRIIPIDGRPAMSEKIRQWPGDGRGRWEGDTLVVESSHFNDKGAWQGSSRHLQVEERFTRTADDSIHYTFTVEDPATWDRPWSAEVPMTTTEGPMYEYACHEGNHDIRHIQEVYRNMERQAAERP